MPKLTESEIVEMVFWVVLSFVFVAAWGWYQHAKAHEVDNACTTGEFLGSAALCQLESNPCTIKPSWHEKWFKYWHHRREMVLKTNRYARCAGRIEERGWNPFVDEFLLNYWDVIPAVPMTNLCVVSGLCKDQGCRDWINDIMDAQVASAVFGDVIWANALLAACESAL